MRLFCSPVILHVLYVDAEMSVRGVVARGRMKSFYCDISPAASSSVQKKVTERMMRDVEECMETQCSVYVYVSYVCVADCI